MWDAIYKLESFTGYRLTDYPTVILKKCFNCKRLKTTEFINEWKYFFVSGKNNSNSDLEQILLESVQGFIQIAQGFDETINAFNAFR
jgi:hypothetical protein